MTTDSLLQRRLLKTRGQKRCQKVRTKKQQMKTKKKTRMKMETTTRH
jgi:hypothetical protein